MGMDHLFDLFFTVVMFPAMLLWFKGHLDRKKRQREATEVHLQNAEALALLIDTMAGFKSDHGKTHYAVKEILEKLNNQDIEKALEQKIKGMMDKKGE